MAACAAVVEAATVETVVGQKGRGLAVVAVLEERGENVARGVAGGGCSRWGSVAVAVVGCAPHVHACLHLGQRWVSGCTHDASKQPHPVPLAARSRPCS